MTTPVLQAEYVFVAMLCKTECTQRSGLTEEYITAFCISLKSVSCLAHNCKTRQLGLDLSLIIVIKSPLTALYVINNAHHFLVLVFVNPD